MGSSEPIAYIPNNRNPPSLPVDKETLLRVEPYRCHRCLEHPWNCNCFINTVVDCFILVIVAGIALAWGL